MNEPLISIIIPTYNRAHLIGETLESIIAQSYRNWECIVVDDGSTDGTDAAVTSYCQRDSRIKYFHRPKDHLPGGNGARNYGFEVSQGEYVNWFDSDDIMCEDFLESGISYLTERQLDFVLFDYEVFNNTTGEAFIHQVNKTDNLIEDYVTFKINFGTWAIIWKRDLIAGYRFNETLTKAQDLDFNFRVFTSAEYNYATINRLGLRIRGHENSIVQDYKRNNIKSISSELYARRNVFLYMLMTTDNNDVLEKCFALYAEPLLKMLRAKKYINISRELFSLILAKRRIFFSNMKWLLKAHFYLFSFAFLNKGEYKLKQVILNYNYNC